MTNILKYISPLFVAALLLTAAPAFAATDVDSLSAGDLIRGTSFSAVYYYGEDGMRYVFPNDKTYFTWYDNFDNVKWLTDADMSTIQIGGNVTYRPGVKMVKIQSDKKVYAVSANGTLRAIGSESVAKKLYGADWNKMIDDVPDGFFSNYTLGGEIEFESQFDKAGETSGALSINDDKNLLPPTVVTINGSSLDLPTITIDAGTAVRWENAGSDKQSVTEWDSAWGSGTLKPGQHFTRYFDEAGTSSYYSKYTDQTEMSGTVVAK